MLTLLAPIFRDREIESLQQQVRKLGFDPATLPGQLSGDLAVVVRQRAPLPEFSVVLGLRPGAATALRGGLDTLAAASGLASDPVVAPALAAWSGFLPIGAVQVRLTADRLVFSTGDATALLSPPPATSDAALAIDLDVPALARTWLPQLLAMVPNKSESIRENVPLVDLVSLLHWRTASALRSMTASQVIDIDAHAEFVHPRKAWADSGGGATPMQPHFGVYGTSRSTLVVWRGAEGWCLMDGLGLEVVTDPVVLAKRLGERPHVAGTPAADLKPIDRPLPPTLDRRWLPPLPAILDHLPASTLRLRPTADGFRLSEEGVPFAGPLLVWLGMVTHGEGERFVRRLRDMAVLRRDGPALRERHARALDALRRTVKQVQSRGRRKPPLMTPSEFLAAAGTDPAELASLFDGVVPDAQRLDRLGFYHPHKEANRIRWSIPLPKGLFLEIAQGVDITWWSVVPQRQPTAEELAGLRPQPAPKPQQPTGVTDF